MNATIEKIRKLLRLAGNNTSAAEASAALAKAQQLATANGISLTEIPADVDAAGGITHSETKVRKDIATRLSAAIINQHFGVQSQIMSGRSILDARSRSVIHIIGTPSQVEIATYIFVFLSRAMNLAWRKRANRRLRDRESFVRGFAYAVSEKLPAVYPQTGLIVSSRAYMDTHLTPEGSTRKKAPPLKKALADSATRAGIEAGSKTQLHQAIRGTSQQLLDF